MFTTLSGPMSIPKAIVVPPKYKVKIPHKSTLVVGSIASRYLDLLYRSFSGRSREKAELQKLSSFLSLCWGENGVVALLVRSMVPAACSPGSGWCSPPPPTAPPESGTDLLPAAAGHQRSPGSASRPRWSGSGRWRRPDPTGPSPPGLRAAPSACQPVLLLLGNCQLVPDWGPKRSAR